MLKSTLTERHLGFSVEITKGLTLPSFPALTLPCTEFNHC